MIPAEPSGNDRGKEEVVENKEAPGGREQEDKTNYLIVDRTPLPNVVDALPTGTYVYVYDNAHAYTPSR